MFSDFVKFNEVLLLVDGKPCSFDYNLVSLDISHDNKVYQLVLSTSGSNNDIVNLSDYLKKQMEKQVSICFKVDYEVKITGSAISDLYRVTSDDNMWLTVCKEEEKDTVVLKCRLIARNNISFNYDNVDLVANF